MSQLGSLIIAGLRSGAESANEAQGLALHMAQIQQSLAMHQAAQRANLSEWERLNPPPASSPQTGGYDAPQGPPALQQQPGPAPMGFPGPAPTNLVQTQPAPVPQSFPPQSPSPQHIQAQEQGNPEYADWLAQRESFRTAPPETQQHILQPLQYMERRDRVTEYQRQLKDKEFQRDMATIEKARQAGHDESDSPTIAGLKHKWGLSLKTTRHLTQEQIDRVSQGDTGAIGEAFSQGVPVAEVNAVRRAAPPSQPAVDAIRARFGDETADVYAATHRIIPPRGPQPTPELISAYHSEADALAKDHPELADAAHAMADAGRDPRTLFSEARQEAAAQNAPNRRPTPEEAQKREEQYVKAVGAKLGGEDKIDEMTRAVIHDRAIRGERVSADDLRAAGVDEKYVHAGEEGALKVDLESAQDSFRRADKAYRDALKDKGGNFEKLGNTEAGAKLIAERTRAMGVLSKAKNDYADALRTRKTSGASQEAPAAAPIPTAAPAAAPIAAPPAPPQVPLVNPAALPAAMPPAPPAGAPQGAAPTPAIHPADADAIAKVMDALGIQPGRPLTPDEKTKIKAALAAQSGAPQ